MDYAINKPVTFPKVYENMELSDKSMEISAHSSTYSENTSADESNNHDEDHAVNCQRYFSSQILKYQ